eukprot:Hpha_TRINITY_DN14949_c3_g12::TRINITY_DN14949_c3_g12_i1::g.144222::m.144222
MQHTSRVLALVQVLLLPDLFILKVCVFVAEVLGLTTVPECRLESINHRTLHVTQGCFLLCPLDADLLAAGLELPLLLLPLFGLAHVCILLGLVLRNQGLDLFDPCCAACRCGLEVVHLLLALLVQCPKLLLQRLAHRVQSCLVLGLALVHLLLVLLLRRAHRCKVTVVAQFELPFHQLGLAFLPVLLLFGAAFGQDFGERSNGLTGVRLEQLVERLLFLWAEVLKGGGRGFSCRPRSARLGPRLNGRHRVIPPPLHLRFHRRCRPLLPAKRRRGSLTPHSLFLVVSRDSFSHRYCQKSTE